MQSTTLDRRMGGCLWPRRSAWFAPALISIALASTSVIAQEKQIFDASVTAYPNHHVGPCPMEISMSGHIYLDDGYKGGPITYRYVLTDGSTTSVETAQYDQQKRRWIRPVKSLPVLVEESPSEGRVVTAYLEVLSPDKLRSPDYYSYASKNPENVKGGAFIKCDAKGKSKPVKGPSRSRFPTQTIGRAATISIRPVPSGQLTRTRINDKASNIYFVPSQQALQKAAISGVQGNLLGSKNSKTIDTSNLQVGQKHTAVVAPETARNQAATSNLPSAAILRSMQASASDSNAVRASSGNTVTTLDPQVLQWILSRPNTSATSAAGFVDTGENIPDKAGAVPLLNEAVIKTDNAEDAIATALPFVSEIWPDASDAGIYYFAPSAYRLSWNNDGSGQLGLEVFHGASSGGNDAGSVTMRATLDSSITSGDIQALKRILDLELRRQNKPLSRMLLPFPLASEPVMTLEQSLSNSGVTEESFQVSQLDFDRLSQMVVEWTTDSVNAEGIMERMRSQSGVSGRMIFPPSDLNGAAPWVNISLNARDSQTYGPALYEERWKNETPFPVTLRKLHALMIGRQAEILSWDLSNLKLETGQVVIFETDGRNLPKHISDNAAKMWIDFDVDRGCRECADNAWSVAASTRASGVNVDFYYAQSLAQYNLELITVYTRSRYFTPQAGSVAEARAINLTQPGSTTQSTPIYPPGGRTLQDSRNQSDPLMEYRLIVVTSDGDEFATEWRPVVESQVRILKSRIPADAISN